MPIGVKGQFRFQFDLGSKADFIEERRFHNFTVIEDAGGQLPTFSLAFETDDNDLLHYINNGQQLKCRFGQSEENYDYTTTLRMSFPIITRVSTDSYLVTMTGVYDALNYINKSGMKIYDKTKTSIEVIKEETKEYFIFDTNLEKADDAMYWIRYGTSAAKFVLETWLHYYYVKESFPMIGICIDGKFIFRDFKTLIEQYSAAPKWIFRYDGEGGNIITITGDYTIKTSDEFLNQWAANDINMDYFDIDAGDSKPIKTDLKVKMANNPKLNRQETSEPKILFGSQSELPLGNVHKFWQQAYINNTANLSVFSSIKIGVTFSGFKDVRLLDYVSFIDDEPSLGSLQPRTNRYYSGNYIVTKVSRTMQGRTVVTYVEMVRETPSELKGELR